MNLKQYLLNRAREWVKAENRAQMLAQSHLKGFPESMPNEYLETMRAIHADVKSHEIDTLIDVGAHKGLFAQAASHFYSFDKILCFEPNTDLHPVLQAATQGLPVVISSSAVGKVASRSTYYAHADSSMSSLVASNEEVLREFFPYDNPDGIEEREVGVQPLDAFLEKEGLSQKEILLKIDTQANELDVLSGAEQVLAVTRACVVEHMFVNAYEANYTFEDLLAFMQKNGFQCRGCLSVSHRPNGAVSSVDFFFTKAA